MSRFGFVGPSYTSESIIADSQECINHYVENNESGMGKSAAQLYRTPGLSLFVNLPGRSVRGQLSINGRLFVVSGTTLYEVGNNGKAQPRGQNILDDGNPASLAASAIQVMVASGGNLYCFDLRTSAFQQVVSKPAAGTGPVGPISLVFYADGYFIGILSGTNQFQLSNLEDGTTWNDLYVAQVSVFPENIISATVAFRELILFGAGHIQAYYDAGDINNPWQPVQGGYIEQGCIATYSPAKMDNSMFWLGGDERGAGIVWRANGYIPQRISNHAIENAINSYSKITDAIGYAYQEKGHTFYCLYFPSAKNGAGEMWVYDAATSLWHKRSRWNGTAFEAHHAQNHAFCFGKHFVGDYSSGNLYQQSISILTDNGNNIRRVRRAPHISSENEWIFHTEMAIDLEMGLGPIPPLKAPSSNPTFYPMVTNTGLVGALTVLDNASLQFQADPILTPEPLYLNDTSLPNQSWLVQVNMLVPNILLADSGANVWQVTIDDSAILHTVLSSGITSAHYLNDAVLPNTSWKLGVTTGGILTVTQVPYSAFYPSSIGMVTSGTSLSATLTVVNGMYHTSVGGPVSQGVYLVQTSIPYNAAYPQSLALATTPGLLNAVISINNAQLQTIEPYPAARDPQIMLRWSDDGGKTWSSERWTSAGQAGTYLTRAIWRRLGKSRDRVYEMVVDDPIDWKIIDAYLKANPGFQTQERMAKSLAKMA